jgi:hypothetical protein
MTPTNGKTDKWTNRQMENGQMDKLANGQFGSVTGQKKNWGHLATRTTGWKILRAPQSFRATSRDPWRPIVVQRVVVVELSSSSCRRRIVVHRVVFVETTLSSQNSWLYMRVGPPLYASFGATIRRDSFQLLWTCRQLCSTNYKSYHIFMLGNCTYQLSSSCHGKLGKKGWLR